ncbi:MAG: hypothetical protein P8J32_07115 [bacterium]|nr:hypothetical protein [bacterium]
MDNQKKLFRVAFVDYQDKDMHVMATSFDDAQRIVMMVKEEIAIQEQEQKESAKPVLNDDGDLYKEAEDSLSKMFEKRKEEPKVSSISVVSDTVYGLETNDM